MAQTGYTPILIYASGTTTNVPLEANLTSSASGAELALNYADGKLFYKDSGGVVQVLATKGAGTIGGSNTQVQYNNSGALAGSANLTFDGTTLSSAGLSNTGFSTLVKTLTLGNSNFNGAAVFAAATPAKLYMGTGTVTDATSAASATNAVGTIASLAITPIAATNTGVTYTNASTLYIAGAPSAGTNVTITNPYALYINSGNVYLGGGTANGVAYLNGSKVVTTGSALTFDGTTFKTSAAGTSVSLSQSTVNSGVAVSRVSGLNGSGTAVIFDQGVNLVNANAFELYDRQNSQQVDTYISGASGYRQFFLNGSEQMRLTSTGLGIGTSSPAVRLSVDSGATAEYARFNSTNASGGYLRFLNSSTTIGYMGAGAQVGGGAASDLGITASNNLVFGYGGGTEGMRLTSTGLGIGTSSPSTKLDVVGTVKSTSSAISDTGIATFGAWTRIQENGFYDASGNFLHNAIKTSGANDTWNYVFSAPSTRYKLLNGVHSWYTAPSGTAGNAITFTQAMTLDASGNLGIGITTPGAKLDVGGNIRAIGTSNSTIGAYANNSSSPQFVLGNSAGTNHWVLYETLGAAGQQGNFTIYDSVAASTRVVLDTSGNLLVGTTGQVSLEKFSVAATGDKQAALFKNDTNTRANIVCWVATTTGNAVFNEFYTETSITARGSISYNRGAGLVAYNTTSDYRAKDIIGLVTDSGALIDSTPVYMGKMKGATQERPMFIAHETPEYAHTGEKDAVDVDGNPVYQQMDASALIPVMWAEIQSLRKRLAALEAK
jgi:hypothetical protein